MQINLQVDTSSPNEIAALLRLANALSGSTQNVSADPPQTLKEFGEEVLAGLRKTGAARTETKLVFTATPTTTVVTESPIDVSVAMPLTDAKRVTVEDIRTAAKNKNKDAVKKEIAKFGNDGLASVPEKDYAALLELVNNCPAK